MSVTVAQEGFAQAFGQTRGTGRAVRLPMPACPYTGQLALAAVVYSGQSGELVEVGWYGSHWTLMFRPEVRLDHVWSGLWLEYRERDGAPIALAPAAGHLGWEGLTDAQQARIIAEAAKDPKTRAGTSDERPLSGDWRRR